MQSSSINKRNYRAFYNREMLQLEKKYYDLFRSKIKVEGDLNDQEKEFLIHELFYKGRVCITKRVDGNPLLCPFTSGSWNIYDYPVNIEYINEKGLQGIFPASMQGINGKDCVIGYIRPCRESIYQAVKHQLTKIADISTTMNVNVCTQRLPFFIAVSPSDKVVMDSIMEKVFAGEPIVYGDFKELENLNVLQGGVYNIDKLRAEKEALENELKTQLGIDNNNNIKKERMIVDEVNANNDEISSSSNVYLTPLEAFSKNIKDVLGFNVSISWDSPIEYESDPKDKEEDETNE